MARRHRTAGVDYRYQEVIPWDARLDEMTPEMRKCRSKRFHDWTFNGDEVTVWGHDRVTVLEFRRTWRCERGCGTSGSELISTRTWKRVEGTYFRYDWDDRYRITGDPIDVAALNREKFIQTNPQLFGYLLVDKGKARERILA